MRHSINSFRPMVLAPVQQLVLPVVGMIRRRTRITQRPQ
jgi:hypothetical protein